MKSSRLSEQPPIRSGAHETGLPLQNSACLIRIALIGRGVVTPTRKPHLKLLRFKESGAYLGPGTRERRRTHVPDCTGTDACISNDKSPCVYQRPYGSAALVRYADYTSTERRLVNHRRYSGAVV